LEEILQRARRRGKDMGFFSLSLTDSPEPHMESCRVIFGEKIEEARRGDEKQKDTSIDYKGVSKRFPEPHIAPNPGSLDSLGAGEGEKKPCTVAIDLLEDTPHTHVLCTIQFWRKAREGEKKRRRHEFLVEQFRQDPQSRTWLKAVMVLEEDFEEARRGEGENMSLVHISFERISTAAYERPYPFF
jgi:hypothetical protein